MHRLLEIGRTGFEICSFFVQLLVRSLDSGVIPSARQEQRQLLFRVRGSPLVHGLLA